MTQAIEVTVFSTNSVLTKGGRFAEILWLAQTR